MTETLMIFALGFLLATLFALMAAQFIWRRAVAATTKRLAAEDTASGPAAPAPLPGDTNEAADAALRAEADTARAEAAARSEEAARLTQALEEAQSRASAAEAALQESGETLAAREAQIARLEAKLNTIKEAATEAAREAASTLSRNQHLTALLAEPAAPSGPDASPGPKTAEKAANDEAPAAEETETPDGDLDNVRADLLSFSEDIKAAFGHKDEDAESDSALQRKDPGEIRPAYAIADPSLDERIRALQKGAPGV